MISPIDIYITRPFHLPAKKETLVPGRNISQGE